MCMAEYSQNIASSNVTLQASSVFSDDKKCAVTTAFDGNKYTTGSGDYIWVSKTSGNEWITVKFNDGPKRIGKYTITNRKLYAECSPKDWILYGSTDNINWIAIDTRTNVSDWASGETKEFIIANSNVDKYQYYKFSFLSTAGGSFFEIAEIEMMELLAFTKYLIKQFNNYYTVKPEYYDSTSKTLIPLTLAGGQIPTKEDILLYAFDDINQLNDELNINGEIFKPINKLSGKFDIKIYKIK